MRLYHCKVCHDWTWSEVPIPRNVWHNNNCQGNYRLVKDDGKCTPQGRRTSGVAERSDAIQSSIVESMPLPTSSSSAKPNERGELAKPRGGRSGAPPFALAKETVQDVLPIILGYREYNCNIKCEEECR